MGRPRGKLKHRFEDRSFCVRFRHPLRPDKVTRLNLGPDQKTADNKILLLNRVFGDPAQWADPQIDDQDLKDMWTGAAAGVHITPKGITVDGKTAPVQAHGEGATAGLYAIIETLQRELAQARYDAKKYKKQLEHHLGAKVRVGASPTLGEARTAWLQSYVGRDHAHMLTVKSDLKKFIDHFTEALEVDALDGEERKIDTWLRGLMARPRKPAKEGDPEPAPQPLSAGRRQQVRTTVLKFLTESGLRLDRKAIGNPTKDQVRADRGAIRWLEKPEAERLVKHLEEPWGDYFRVQVGLGLRPDELITLQRDNFTKDFSSVTLAKLGNLTLKNRPRTIHVPATVRAVIKARAAKNPIIFPNPNSNTPWHDPHWYNTLYREALRAAAVKASIKTRVDCRTGRRTCGSILLRSGKSAEEVAAILGDDSKTVREHYAAILSHEVDPSAAALKAK